MKNSNATSDQGDFFVRPPLGASDRARFAKRIVDFCGALAAAVLFAPLMLAVALGVLLSSGRPVVFRQRRVGLNGELFDFFKFRSMRRDAESVLQSYLDNSPEAAESWRKYQKLDSDPRITRFGKFIRKTSLDELPQFWNVIRGDMSLVGPRPVTYSEKSRYGQYWSYYCAVKPGITGLWQVSGRSNMDYEQRVQLDVHYVTHRSIAYDFKILLKTIRVVLSREGSV